MLINWFTVVAQAVNFLILIFLLHRFLFKPILAAMAKREKTMADALSRAEAAEDKALESARELEGEKESLKTARETLLAETRAEVARWREEALQSARDEVEALRRAWTESLSRERQAFLDGLKVRLVEQVVAVGEKVIRDLANERLNGQVLRVFLERVGDQKNILEGRGGKKGIHIQSGFSLMEADIRMLEDGFSRWLPEHVKIQVEIQPELGPGIALVAGDQRISWHLSDYLEELESEIKEKLWFDGRT